MSKLSQHDSDLVWVMRDWALRIGTHTDPHEVLSMVTHTLENVGIILAQNKNAHLNKYIIHDFEKVFTMLMLATAIDAINHQQIIKMFLSACDHLTWVLLMRSDDYRWVYERGNEYHKSFPLDTEYLWRIFFPYSSDSVLSNEEELDLSDAPRVVFPPMILLVVLHEMLGNSEKIWATEFSVQFSRDDTNLVIDISDNGWWVDTTIQDAPESVFQEKFTWTDSTWLWLAGLPEIFQRYGAEITATVSEEGTKIKWNRKLLFHIRIPLIRSSSSLLPSSPHADPGTPA